MNLKKLFFSTEKGTIELENPLSIDNFHSVLITEFNFCNDYRLDYEYLNMLYERYIEVFHTNVGSFSIFFKNLMKENGIKNIRLDNIKPYMVFGDDV